VYRGGTGQLTWLAHRISGVAVVYFLSLHIFETLQLGLGPGAYDEATAVYKQPWFRPFEFLLVMAVVYHGLNGLRVMLFDYFPRATRYRNQIFWIGVALFVVLTPLIGFFMLRPIFGLSLPEIFADLRSAPYAALIVGPVAIPVLYLLWRGTALSEGRKPILSASNSSAPPTASGFEQFAWGFMRVSGLILVVLVFLHLFIMHLERDIVQVTGEFVIDRFRANPIWQFVDLAMLFFAWLHGLNGVRLVLTDYMRRGAPRKFVLYAIGAFGVVWLVAGSVVLFTFPLGVGA
jgi:succinate dehydrogenase cytochrome b556 subunit